MDAEYWRPRDAYGGKLRIRTSCNPGDLGQFPDILTHNEKIASQWLLALYQNTTEKLWFTSFAQYYSCELEAAFVYLGLDLD